MGQIGSVFQLGVFGISFPKRKAMQRRVTYERERLGLLDAVKLRSVELPMKENKGYASNPRRFGAPLTSIVFIFLLWKSMVP